jgi:tetratricopeptide (TPR) repeat protein
VSENDIQNTPPPAAHGPSTQPSEPHVLGTADHVHYARYQQRSNKLLWGIFGLLLALVGAVFFVLPNYVAPPDPNSVVVVPAALTAPAATAALSPFEEAQKMRQREAAQTALATLLELQEELEGKDVLEWAAEPFNAAIEQARSGDEAYRQQRFAEAATFYQAGVDALEALKSGEAPLFAALLSEGNAALSTGDAAAATSAFNRALLIDPRSRDASSGLARAAVLTEVLALLQNGRNLQAGRQFEQARELYRQAQALDAAHPDVASALREVDTAIADRDFAAAMSRGYSALQGGDSAAALRAFEQARAMRPNSTDVEAGLQQARDRQTFAAISVHIDTALMHENNEEWAQALAAWDQALAVDPNLVDAIEGRQRSESRRLLDEYLVGTLANPLRVAEPDIYAQTQKVIADAERVLLNPGPRLSSQFQQVKAFLERALVPVDVQLQSDGVTKVTVYRVAELGTFTRQTLNLMPGQYVAVGVRAGYRDVREEFVVGLDGQVPVVTVACSEAI